MFYLKIKSKIDIHLSFFIAAIIFIALGYIEQFFMLLFAVTLHELAHVAVAGAFQLKTEKIIFTPLGLTAVIKQLEKAPSSTRAATLLAGPLSNLLLYMSSPIFDYINPHFSVSWRFANLSILMLNLLPVYPLDGGKLLQQLLGNTLGVIPGNKLLLLFSKLFAALIIFTGIVQMILFPYNISLLCIGVYILKQLRHAHLQMTLAFYMSLINKNALHNDLCPVVRIFAVRPSCPLRSIINRFRRDYIHVVQVMDEGKILCTLTESDIAGYIMRLGLQGTALDVELFLSKSRF